MNSPIAERSLVTDAQRRLGIGIEAAPAERSVNRCRQLLLIGLTAAALAALVSHGIATWVRIEKTAGTAFVIGTPNQGSAAYLAGSSLAGNAVAWPAISEQVNLPIHAWAIAGGSPFEWEQFQPQVSRPQISFIVISAYDMNEALICDYRAQLVPLGHSIRTLVNSDVDLGYAKRALSQYPMTWLRTLYPTLGRSRGIMGDLRNRIAAMIKPESAEDAPEAGPTLDFGQASEKKRISSEAISGWSQSEILRKVAVMRESAQGRQIFRGPKHDALARMAAHAAQQGRTVIVVLPVSATYGRAVAGTAAGREFQDALDRIARQVPAANWLRLDQIPGLDADDYYMDLVHMNYRGQEIATAHLQRWLNGPAETQ